MSEQRPSRRTFQTINHETPNHQNLTSSFLCLPLVLWSQDVDSASAVADSLKVVESLADGPMDSAMDVFEVELENTPAEDSSGVAIQEDMSTQGTDGIIQRRAYPNRPW